MGKQTKSYKKSCDEGWPWDLLLESFCIRRFWTTDGNRKFPVFLFNLYWHHHIFIAKYLFTSTNDWFEKVGETTVLANEKFSSGFRPWLKNVTRLSPLYILFQNGGQ